jgi:hypothetical protein
MPPTVSRDELKAHYDGAFAAVPAAIEGLSDAQLSEPAADGWSVHDHLVHLAVWHEIRVQEIERVSRGDRPAWPPNMTDKQVDTINDLTVELRRALPVEQVVREYGLACQRVLQAIAAASDRALDETLYGESGIRSSHDVEHAEAIRAWRSGRGY